MYKIESYVHRNLEKDRLLREKEEHERSIALWEHRVQFVDELFATPAITQNAVDFLSAFNTVRDRYPTVLAHAVIPDAEAFIWRFLHSMDYDFYSGLRDNARSACTSLAYNLSNINERLASIGGTQEQEITIRGIRDMFKPLSYVKKGSVNLFEDTRGHRYLRFTLCNTYISSDEPWNMAINSGLLPSAYQSVVPLEAAPSFLLTPLSVTINLTVPNININKTSAKYKMNFIPGGHPHAPGLNPCLGSFAEPLKQAVVDLDFISMASIVRMWAQVAVLSDGWGRSFISGFTYILRKVLDNPYASIYADLNLDHLLFDGKPVYFQETAPGVYTVTVGEKSYVYDPNQL